MTIQEHFKKFYNMEPYIFIDEKEWKSIMDTYDKEDVIEELSKVLHTYRPPIPVISEQQALSSLNKLKKSWWPDILVNKKWFPRNERKSKYPLSPYYFKRDNSGTSGSKLIKSVNVTKDLLIANNIHVPHCKISGETSFNALNRDVTLESNCTDNTKSFNCVFEDDVDFFFKR